MKLKKLKIESKYLFKNIILYVFFKYLKSANLKIYFNCLIL